MVVQRFVAGDSRIWKLDKVKLIREAQAPESVTIEAFVRTVETTLVALKVETDSADLILSFSSAD